jgi:hypothetical protein
MVQMQLLPSSTTHTHTHLNPHTLSRAAAAAAVLAAAALLLLQSQPTAQTVPTSSPSMVRMRLLPSSRTVSWLSPPSGSMAVTLLAATYSSARGGLLVGAAVRLLRGARLRICKESGR